MATLVCRDKTLHLSRTAVMGIINLTPDSFVPASRQTADTAVAAALHMAAQGAAVLDIGACSTRPGSTAVPPEEELRRLLPALTAIRRAVELPLSVDTTCPQTAKAALEAGADILNDVSGSLDSPLFELAAASGAALVVMHAGGGADDRALDDALPAVRRFFEAALQRAQAVGLPLQRLCLDPGIGFGKSLQGDRQLIANLPELLHGLPDVAVLVGASRKRVTAAEGDTAADRLEATLALHSLAQWGGAHLLRVHDVGEAVRAARAVDALRCAKKS